VRRHQFQRGFTLLELLVVIFIIAIAVAFLIPSISTSSGRSVDAAASQLKADLEQARLTAIAERTRTRIILPTSTANFAGAASSPAPWPSDITLRGYVMVSEKRDASPAVWKQRGKWNRFPEGVAMASISPTPSPTAVPIDVGGTGATTYTFAGPYIEFLANGSSNLDPTASPAPAAIVADGFVDSSGTFKPKDVKLHYTITVDPLTGAVSVQ
jgi:prepilin-type N-terminal cleavage/methylation domain-containing protein